MHVAEEYCWAMTLTMKARGGGGGRAAADQVPLCRSSNVTGFLSLTASGVTKFTGPQLLFALFAGLLSPQAINYSVSSLLPIPFPT
jgi:hypothetical protein